MKSSISTIRTSILLVTFAIFFFSVVNGQQKTIKGEVDIYIGGYSMLPNGKLVAKYLKNGVPVQIGDGNTHSIISAIAVKDNVVYAAGGHDQQLTFWKDGQETFLTQPKHAGEITSILVDDGNVYITGMDRVPNGYLQLDQATYWKNGSQIFLPDGKDGVAVALALDYNGDEYIVGVKDFQTKYWKNGALMEPTDKSAKSIRPFAMKASNGQLYVAGFKTLLDEGQYSEPDKRPAYWTTGGIVYLPDSGRGNGVVTSIAVVGKNVYAAGFNSRNAPCYWINDKMFELTAPKLETIVLDKYHIAVHGNDVYVAGNDANGGQCWKNGEPILNAGSLGKALCITVVPRNNDNSSKLSIAKNKNKAIPSDAIANVDNNKINNDLKKNENTLTEEFKRQPGVQKTKSGLVYQVIAEGTGAKPLLNDNIKILFKSSYIMNNIEHPRPADTRPQIINIAQHPIPLLQEALLQMKSGGRYKFLLLPNQLSGKSSPGLEAMIYDVEFIEIVK